jgi:uncharacterized protein (TIGR03435 family)
VGILKGIGISVKPSIWKISVLLPLAALPAFAQAPPASPLAFEVATIKPADPITPAMLQAGKMHVGLAVDQARVDIGFVSLFDMVAMAYKVKSYQIQGPDTLRAQRFDVLAKMPPGATKDDVPAMLQKLLADRFKLQIHRETKEHAVWGLVVAKGGIKMKPAVADEPVAEGHTGPPGEGGAVMGQGDNAVRVKVDADGRGGVAQTAKNGKIKTTMNPDNSLHYAVDKMDMPGLCDTFSAFLDKPVVDMTELKGQYQVAFDLSMADLMAVARKNGAGALLGGGGAPDASKSAAESASEPGGSTILSAVGPLGLKLEPRKAPLENIVIDHAEKMPTEN